MTNESEKSLGPVIKEVKVSQSLTVAQLDKLDLRVEELDKNVLVLVVKKLKEKLVHEWEYC